MNPYRSYGSPKERAKSLLAHYFELSMDSPLSDDGYNEIGQIVDCIMQAVEEQTVEYRLKKLESSVAYFKGTRNTAIAFLEKVQSVFSDLGGTDEFKELDRDFRERLCNLEDEINDFLSE